MDTEIHIEKFDKRKYDRNDFDCGVASLNHFIKRQVSQDERRNLNRCYVLVDDGSKVLGYFTLSSHSIVNGESELTPSAPYEAIPAVLIGRLAVCKSAQGKGYGRALIVQALTRVVRLHVEIGVNVVVVDPLDEDVVDLYRKFGFEETQSGQLLLLVKVAKQAMEKAGRL